MIYKIFRTPEWQHLQQNARTDGAPIDLADGFIHFSTATQTAETLARHFAGQDGLWLAAVDDTTLGAALRWEPSRGGALFPHLYRALDLAEVAWCKPIEMADKGHILPADLA